jgi:hypothetical protein
MNTVAATILIILIFSTAGLNTVFQFMYALLLQYQRRAD